MVDQVTFIEQNGKCIIRNFGRPCDEFAERVWPIKISDGARVTLFNKGLVSCDVNQSFFNFAVWVRVCKLYDDILYILLSKILYDVTSSSSSSSLDIMRYCTAVDNRKDEKAWYKTLYKVVWTWWKNKEILVQKISADDADIIKTFLWLGKCWHPQFLRLQYICGCIIVCYSFLSVWTTFFHNNLSYIDRWFLNYNARILGTEKKVQTVWKVPYRYQNGWHAIFFSSRYLTAALCKVWFWK